MKSFGTEREKIHPRIKNGFTLLRRRSFQNWQSTISPYLLAPHGSFLRDGPCLGVGAACSDWVGVCALDFATRPEGGASWSTMLTDGSQGAHWSREWQSEGYFSSFEIHFMIPISSEINACVWHFRNPWKSEAQKEASPHSLWQALDIQETAEHKLAGLCLVGCWFPSTFFRITQELLTLLPETS